jgi:BCD family chlorophyll transporter-like MFS transporter
VGLPAFVAVMAAASLQSVPLFVAGVAAIGLGVGLFGHGTLTLTMNRAPADQAGLALGIWGAVQATSAGAAVAAGGALRDALDLLFERGASAYQLVYAVELALLVTTLVIMRPLLGATLAPLNPPANQRNPP